MAPAVQSQTHARTPGQLTPDPVWIIRSASSADMEYLSTRLTPASLAEMAALAGCENQPACTDCQPLPLLLKDIALKGVVADKRTPEQPVAVFDLSPVPQNEGTAVFWAALTEGVAQSEGMWSLNAHVRNALNYFNGLHPRILTFVDKRNVRHAEWLERIGFKFVREVEDFGTAKLPFHLYQREKV